MAKLLTEPRIPKAITVPKPRKKRIKRSPEEPKVKYTLLKESDKKHLLRFIDLYKENPLHARVKFFADNNTGLSDYSFNRLVIFEFGDTDFEISEFKVKFGISITNRIYSSQSKIRSIMYKKGKFWYLDKSRTVRGAGSIMPLSFGLVHAFIQNAEIHNLRDINNDSKIFDFLKKRFHWFKTIHEHKYAWNLSFTKIVKDELFNFKLLNREIFKVPNNIAEIVVGSQSDRGSMLSRYGSPRDFIKVWKEVVKVLDNVQSLTPEMMYHRDFMDTCKMARRLGKRVNCQWGLKRMTQEHDEWAKEITHIMLACEKEYLLDVRKHFRMFGEYSGYQLLKTNKEMLFEGMTQNHCVGTYLDKVDNGSCAIFHIEGFTLQVVLRTTEVFADTGEPIPYNLNIGSYQMTVDADGNEIQREQRKTKHIYSLANAQFRGRHNSDPTEELKNRVNAKLKEFSDSDLYKEYLENPNDEKFKVEDQWAKGVNGFQNQLVEEQLPF